MLSMALLPHHLPPRSPEAAGSDGGLPAARGAAEPAGGAEAAAGGGAGDARRPEAAPDGRRDVGLGQPAGAAALGARPGPVPQSRTVFLPARPPSAGSVGSPLPALGL